MYLTIKIKTQQYKGERTFVLDSPGNFALRLDPDASVRTNSNQPYKTILS